MNKKTTTAVSVAQPAADTLLFTFTPESGENPTTMQALLAELPEEIVTQCTIFGLKQKLVDAAALPRDSVTGKSASAAEKEAAIRETYDRLKEGSWNATRESGESYLVRALKEVYPDKADAVPEWVAGLSSAHKTALSRHPKVAAAIDRYRAESVRKSSVDADALLDSLLNDDDAE